ncbi:MAG: bacterial transcriptional activator domain-containing protein, partial [Pseudomonadota bacterium]
ITSTTDTLSLNSQKSGGPFTDIGQLEDMSERLRRDAEFEAIDLADLRDLMLLYKGDLAPTIAGEWIDPPRRRLRDLFIDCVDRGVDVALALHDADSAVDFARRQVELEPLHESANRRLMLLYIDQGDRAHAVQHYLSFKSLLQTELGVTPSEETRALYDAQRRDDRQWRVAAVDDDNSTPDLRQRLQSMKALTADLSSQINDLLRQMDKI